MLDWTLFSVAQCNFRVGVHFLHISTPGQQSGHSSKDDLSTTRQGVDHIWYDAMILTLSQAMSGQSYGLRGPKLQGILSLLTESDR
jgi:hypothetical protein